MRLIFGGRDQLQVVLGAPKGQRRLAVVPLAAKHLVRRSAQRQPLNFESLMGVRRGRPDFKIARQVKVNHFREYAGSREELAQGRPSPGGHPGFFGQFAYRTNLRRLARIQFAGGDLPQKIRDAVPVLAHQADAGGGVHGDHCRSTGMTNEVEIVFPAVRIAEALGGDVDDTTAVNVLAVNGGWFTHRGSLPAQNPGSPTPEGKAGACDLSPRARGPQCEILNVVLAYCIAIWIYVQYRHTP